MHIKTAPAWQYWRECSMSSHTSCACRYAQSKYGYRRRRRHHRHPFSQMRPQKPKARQAKLPPHSPVLLPSPSSGPCPPHTPSRSGQATLDEPLSSARLRQRGHQSSSAPGGRCWKHGGAWAPSPRAPAATCATTALEPRTAGSAPSSLSSYGVLLYGDTDASLCHDRERERGQQGLLGVHLF